MNGPKGLSRSPVLEQGFPHLIRHLLDPLETAEKKLTMDSHIKEKRRNRNGKGLRLAWCLSLSFGWTILWGLAPLLCAGAEVSSKHAPFSLSASNERLDAVLEKISKASGYAITINEGWRNKVVTVRLENVTVEEGVKSLIDALGRPSHLLLYDRTQKKIEIVMIPGGFGSSESSTRSEPPSRPLRQIGPSSPERTTPQVRPVPRRTRQRVMPPPSPPEEIQEPGREEVPVVQPEADTKTGEAPGETPDSPEEATPDSKLKGGPERKRRPADSSEDKSAVSGP
jgi:hypothetical protein